MNTDHAKQIAELEHSGAKTLLQLAQSCKIDSQEVAEMVADDLCMIKARLKALEEKRTSITKPLNDSLKIINAFFKEPSIVLEQAESAYKKALALWTDSERLRLQKQRQEQQAELDKIAADLKKEADAAQKELDDAQKLGDDELLYQLQIKAAETSANAVVMQHMAPAIQAAPEKLAGISSRESWDFEIIDAKLIPREFLIVDEKKIRAIVKQMKGETSIAGVRAYSETTMAVRSSK